MVTLRVLPQVFTICKPLSLRDVDWGIPYQFAAVTEEEISLVCPEAAAPPCTEQEGGWRGLYVEGKLDFGLVGILAPIAVLLADRRIGIFVVSTYDTDYVFVKAQDLEPAKAALRQGGYRFSN